MPTQEELNKGFSIGAWTVLPARGELRRGDEVVQPEHKVFQALLALARRDGDLVSKDELVAEVWDGRATADDPIIRCIHQLRNDLGDKVRPFQYVDTLVRRGYCLKQPVILLEPATEESPPPAAPASRASRFWAALALAIVLAVAGYFAWTMLLPRPIVNSIGVLPIRNLTGDPANDYIASGFKEELVHTLQNNTDIAVKSGHVDYEGLEITEKAARLGVESVLSGALQKIGNELLINYQVARATDGVNVSSGRVSGQLEELFPLQEELARQVLRDLGGGRSKQLLSSSRPANSEAYNRYIRGLFALERRGVPGNLEDAIALLEDAIRLDRNFGPAYLALAEIYVLLPDYRGVPLAETHARAIEIVEQGIAVDPAIEDAASAVFGFVYHKQKKWAQAEEAFMRATSARKVESNAFNWYSLMLGSVGRFDEALEMALAALEIDPSSAVINSRVAIIYTWIDDTAKAMDFFERSNLLGASGSNYLLANALVEARQGNFEKARQLTHAGVRIVGGTDVWVDPAIAALTDPTQRGDALAALDKARSDGQINPQVEVTLRMILGDTDGALRVARALAQPGQSFEMELLFLPEFMSLRERPEFLELMDALGVTDYWAQAGCTWRDLAVHCPG